MTVKQAGKRSAGKPHAAFDEGGGWKRDHGSLALRTNAKVVGFSTAMNLPSARQPRAYQVRALQRDAHIPDQAAGLGESRSRPRMIANWLERDDLDAVESSPRCTLREITRCRRFQRFRYLWICEKPIAMVCDERPTCTARAEAAAGVTAMIDFQRFRCRPNPPRRGNSLADG